MFKTNASKSFTLLLSIVMSLFHEDDVEIGKLFTKFTGLVESKIFSNVGMSLTAGFRMAFFCLGDFFNMTPSTSLTKLTITSL